jgi:hypothetical protein
MEVSKITSATGLKKGGEKRGGGGRALVRRHASFHVFGVVSEKYGVHLPTSLFQRCRGAREIKRSCHVEYVRGVARETFPHIARALIYCKRRTNLPRNQIFGGERYYAQYQFPSASR